MIIRGKTGGSEKSDRILMVSSRRIQNRTRIATSLKKENNYACYQFTPPQSL